MSDLSFTAEFTRRKDLERYRHNALLVYALELRYQLEDIHAVADVSLTDGPDDRKCDLVYIDKDRGCAVIAQSYFSMAEFGTTTGKANKASDMNTAVAWMLSEEEVPERLRLAANELRQALSDGEIVNLELWYVHNQKESIGVENELSQAQRTADALCKRYFPTAKTEISYIEVGVSTLNDWYESQTVQILVNDELEVDIPGAYEIADPAGEWRAVTTSVPAAWLHDLYKKFGTQLNSANVRNYLGSRKAAANINNSIKDTAKNDPSKFWTYNNGITALCRGFVYDNKDSKLLIEGISIVNGAQTTGAIGSLSERPSANMWVPARFVHCKNQSIIYNIIRYNNSQNPVRAADFRSNDKIQKELRIQFKSIPDCHYSGGRRGGEGDAMQRQANGLPSETVGQVLASFAGHCDIAYHKKSKIWEDDALYSRYFREHETTARNIVFTYALWLAINSCKDELKAKPESDLKSNQKAQLSTLKKRGATLLLLGAIAESLESILNKPIPSRKRIQFKLNLSPIDAALHWEPIVRVSLSFCKTLDDSIENGLRSEPKMTNVLRGFSESIDAVSESNRPLFSAFADKVSIS